MKKLSSGFIFITLAVLVFFYQFIFLNKLPIPADTITGLYHPFRDFYASEYPSGMTYKNFLITDPVRQQFPWRLLAVEEMQSVELPLWNPYNFAGTPLLANFQTGAFYPLNTLLFILPFSFSWSLLVMLQPLLGGTFLYYFLKEKKLENSASLLAAIAFAFSGFSISWLEWNTLFHVTIWLPLILLAKEKLLQKISIKWIMVLIFAECSAIFAGHLQTLFYLWFVSTTYLFFRIVQISWSKKSFTETLQNMTSRTLPFIPVVGVILILTSIQWLPTLFFIQESARGIDQISWNKEGWFIPYQHLIQFIVPDFFGNPTTLNYWGTWNYAEMVGYIGIAPLILALFALFFRRDKLVLYFGSVFFISLFFALPTFLAKIPYILNLPFISTSQPTRLLFLTDFSLAILAGLGLDQMIRTKKGILYPLIFVGVVLLTIWFMIILGVGVSGKFLTNISVVKSNLLLPTITFIVVGALLLIYTSTKKRLSTVIISGLIVVTFLDLLRFGWKFTPFTDETYLFPKTKITNYLTSHAEASRVMSLDSRILPPNFGATYKIQTIEGYDPLYLSRYGELIEMMENRKSIVPKKLSFNRTITPRNYTSSVINFLNVKYILSFEELKSDQFKKIMQEGQTLLYENKSVLPRAYFIRNIIPSNSKQQTADALFNISFDPSIDAVVESASELESVYSTGSATIREYSPNKVTIDVINSQTGFLFLSDSYYPTWDARIVSGTGDIQSAKILITNYNFRGVVVPANSKEVIFTNTLLNK